MNPRTLHGATVVGHVVLSDHLVRLELQAPEAFASTGIPDEWVALTVPGQYQTRYYTVRDLEARRLVVDVVVHEEGLVTGWARTDACVGDVVGLGEPKGSFELPPDAGWVVLAGDLTALPAMARTASTIEVPWTAYVETPDGPMPDYLPGQVSWHHAPAGESRLAEIVRDIDWPSGPGYFWMAGESAQMRDVRRHVRRELGWDTRHHEVMGYWSGSRGRRARQVDPAPLYARGKAEGRSDAEIWEAYDRERGL